MKPATWILAALTVVIPVSDARAQLVGGQRTQSGFAGGGGPTGAGFFTQELPAGFRIQGINPPTWKVPGFGAAGINPPKARILRTPSSQRLANRLEARQNALRARSMEHRAALLSRRRDTRSGASYDYLRRRRSRQEGDRITPAGVIPGEMAVPRGLSRRSIRATKKVREAPEKEPTVHDQAVAEWNAERAERRRQMEEVMARLTERGQARRAQGGTSSEEPTRRYGMRGGLR